MPFDLTRLPLVDLILFALGALIVAGAFARSVLRGSLASDLRLPEPPAHSLNRFDIVLAVWTHVSLAAIFVMIADAILKGMGTAPAIAGSSIPSSAVILGGTAGAAATAIVLFLIGRIRFDGARAWGLDFRHAATQLPIALCVTIAVMPICYGILGATGWLMVHVFELTPKEHGSIELLREGGGPTWTVGLTILNAVLLAPIVEELLFRGLLLPSLAKWLKSPAMGLAVSSILFGLIHYNVAKTVPALIVFGVVLGATYLKTRSLVAAILVHALFNAKTILWLLLGWPG